MVSYFGSGFVLTGETFVVPPRGCATETDINRLRLELPILGAQPKVGCVKTSGKKGLLSHTNVFIFSLGLFSLSLSVMSLVDARVAVVRDDSSGRTWVVVTLEIVTSIVNLITRK